MHWQTKFRVIDIIFPALEKSSAGDPVGGLGGLSMHPPAWPQEFQPFSPTSV